MKIEHLTGANALVQGDAHVFDVDVDTPDGSDKDLTGGSVDAVIADDRGGTVRVSKDTGGDGIVWTDRAAGQFEVHLDTGDTKDLLGTYWLEVEVTDSDGNQSTVLAGDIEFARSTT